MQKTWRTVREMAEAMGLEIEEESDHRLVVRGVERVIIAAHGTARLETGRPKVVSAIKAIHIATGVLNFADL